MSKMIIKTNKLSEAFQRDVRRARLARADVGAFCIYQIKKNGERYARPHEHYSGRTTWATREEAEAEAQRMRDLNPSLRFEVFAS